MKKILMLLLCMFICFGCNESDIQDKGESISVNNNTYRFHYQENKNTLIMWLNDEEIIFSLNHKVQELPIGSSIDDIVTRTGVGYLGGEKKVYFVYYLNTDGTISYQEMTVKEMSEEVKQRTHQSLTQIWELELELAESCDPKMYEVISNFLFAMKHYPQMVFEMALEECDFPLEIKLLAMDIYLDTLKCITLF